MRTANPTPDHLPAPSAAAAPDPAAPPRRLRTPLRAAQYVGLAALLIVFFVRIRDAQWVTDERVHMVYEVAATMLAFTAGAMALVRFYARRDRTFLLIGSAFVGTALLDGYHALVTSPFFATMFPSAPASLIPWSWAASRLYLAVLLFASWAVWKRQRRAGEWGVARTRLVYASMAAATLAAVFLFAFVPLPQAYYPDLLFVRPGELIPAVFFLAALAGYLVKGRWRYDGFEHWLVLSLIVGFVGQATFMAFSASLFDAGFDAAHLLKAGSYTCVVIGLLVSMYGLFQRVERTTDVLATANVQLGAQAAELEEARDRAVEATEFKTQLLTNVSHEIRTPMNAILGMTELALATDLTAEQREYLGTTKSSIDALITLVNDLLDLSKIEAGKLQLEDIPFSLKDAVGDTVRTLAVRAAAKELELNLESLDNVPDAISGDPGRLRQVLVNLIGNAIKFTNVGGVTIGAEVWAQRDHEIELHFRVADTGIGIPADKRDEIFQAFAQADSSTSREYGGTGLGLAISAELVEMMGGRMWLEAEENVGSTFHFTIVVHRTAAAAGVFFAPVEPSDGTRLRVALVADSDDARRAGSEILRQAELIPVPAGGPDDPDVSAMQTCDVVIVDVERDSVEVCRRITDLVAAAPVAVVSHGVPGDAAVFRAAGAAAYLPKPVAADDLTDAIRHTARTWRPGDPLVTTHWLRERRPKLHVLVADDSAANRQLASRLLEKRGHRVTTVADGARAVDAVGSGAFDVVLMDVQMPEMDGLEATRRIRRTDETLPIVALTAHAMAADRERCLEAGMDAYVSKPFNPYELYATLEQLCGGAARPPLEWQAEADPDVDAPPLDMADALSRVGGDPALLAEVAQLFMEDVPLQREAIARGLGSRDWEPLVLASHTLKGTLAMLGAVPASEAASAVVDAARAQDYGATMAANATLESELARLEPILEGIVTPAVVRD